MSFSYTPRPCSTAGGARTVSLMKIQCHWPMSMDTARSIAPDGRNISAPTSQEYGLTREKRSPDTVNPCNRVHADAYGVWVSFRPLPDQLDAGAPRPHRWETHSDTGESQCIHPCGRSNTERVRGTQSAGVRVASGLKPRMVRVHYRPLCQEAER